MHIFSLHKVLISAIAVAVVLHSPLFARTGVATVNEQKAAQEDWLLQYDELQKEISAPLSKRSVTDPKNVLDADAFILPQETDPLEVALRRTGDLIGDLEKGTLKGGTAFFERRLAAIKSQLAGTSGAVSSHRDLYLRTTALRREVMLSASAAAVDFDTLLFIARGVLGGGHGEGDHMCDQYYGFNALPGGSLYLACGLKSGTATIVDLCANAKVQNGRFAGKTLAGGSFLSPDLSYDGTQVVFAWKEPSARLVAWTKTQCFHLFKINIDGTGLTQLTDTSFNDFDPLWLPSGRIVFVSDRRGGFGRCHGRPVPTYTLYSTKADGSDVICLSFHETNEWHPSVDNDGKIVYTRWDYIDREDCIAHHLWTCFPDGRDPRSPHGNYPTPLTTTTGSGWADGKNFRPNAEFNIRPMPLSSGRYIATAAFHHAQSFGQLILVDVNIPDNDSMSQITGITTTQRTWSDGSGAGGPWGTPWPLNDDYYLCSYDAPDTVIAGDIVLLNKNLSREVLVRKADVPGANLAKFKLIDPIPVRPRAVPPDHKVQTFQGERAGYAHQPATIKVLNVYKSDIPIPTATVVKWLRVVQVIPKSTQNKDVPRTGYYDESLVRIPLGVVPVESDGSVNFEAPVDRCIYFQALDENGCAVQSMRSGTYVHRGEALSCVGCHENKWEAPPPLTPIAWLRQPSRIKPEIIDGAIPFSFYRLVKPVFDSSCRPCHVQRALGPDMTYASLKNYAFGYTGSLGGFTNPVPWGGPGSQGGSRTIPGRHGALAALLFSYCNPSHYNVQLTADQLRRITLWLDLNCNEYGTYDPSGQALQLQGRVFYPELDFDRNNPLGVEEPRSDEQAVAVVLTPASAMVKPGGTVQFSGLAVDSLNRVVDSQPAFEWSVSGGGTIDRATGLFTAGSTEGGPHTVTATVTVNGTRRTFQASVIISSLGGLLLVNGVVRQMLCLHGADSSTKITVMTDTAAIEGMSISGPSPVDGTRLTVGGIRTYTWKDRASADGIWFSSCCTPYASYGFITIVNNSQRPFKIGYVHDDDMTIWMNGTKLFSDTGWSAVEELSRAFTLPRGTNAFLVKITNKNGPGSLSMRFADSTGAGISDLLYFTDPAQTSIQGIPQALAPVKNARVAILTRGALLLVEGDCGGMHRVDIFNAQGRLLFSKSGTGNARYALAAGRFRPGVLLIRLSLDGKRYAKSVVLMKR